MTNEDFATEKARLFARLSTETEGSEAYKHILDDLTNLQRLETSIAESESKIACEQKNLEIEELKVQADAKASELRYKSEKKSNRGRIAVAIIGLLGALGLGVMTIEEEETRAITSKAKQFGSDILSKTKY